MEFSYETREKAGVAGQAVLEYYSPEGSSKINLWAPWAPTRALAACFEELYPIAWKMDAKQRFWKRRNKKGCLLSSTGKVVPEFQGHKRGC